MFGIPYALDVTGTEVELLGNSRVFDIEVYKPEHLHLGAAFKFVVTANSFTQAAAAAIEQANILRKLYLEQNEGDLLIAQYKAEYTPADVRKMEVVRTHVYHFRHK